MSKIEIRYTVKKPSGHVLIETFPLRDIELGYYKTWRRNNSIGIDCEIFKDRYTGLLDKNGKKIFDGDKLLVKGRHGEYMKTVVSYSGKTTAYWVGDAVTNISLDFLSAFSDIEITENIHE